MDLAGYKDVFADGPPSEDGAYLVVMADDEATPQLLVRSKQQDGSILWVTTDRKQVNEDNILLYKKVVITPDAKNKQK